MLQTEYEFTLPRGYVDDDGNIHRTGIMRMATAADEILPLKDPRVQNNPAYLVVILLSRVVVRLGSLSTVTPQTIENLYTADLAYLQDFYNEINQTEPRMISLRCPKCGEEISVEATPLGGS